MNLDSAWAPATPAGRDRQPLPHPERLAMVPFDGKLRGKVNRLLYCRMWFAHTATCRNLAALPADAQITVAEARQIAKLFYRYRRQLRCVYRMERALGRR
jgi:hypothetical protein